MLQKYVQHLEQSLENRHQDFLEVAREKRQLESQIKRFERQPPEARFGDLFDGKEKLPSKLRVNHFHTVEGLVGMHLLALGTQSHELRGVGHSGRQPGRKVSGKKASGALQ